MKVEVQQQARGHRGYKNTWKINGEKGSQKLLRGLEGGDKFRKWKEEKKCKKYSQEVEMIEQNFSEQKFSIILWLW